jgi:hypothetical protein
MVNVVVFLRVGAERGQRRGIPACGCRAWSTSWYSCVWVPSVVNVVVFLRVGAECGQRRGTPAWAAVVC